MTTMTMKSSLEIAQEATLRPVMDIAREIGLEEDEVDLYGRYKGKISLGAIDRLAGAPEAKIVCVSAITPTKAGEGKTTTSVSLTQGLGHIGKRPVLCLRDPALVAVEDVTVDERGEHVVRCGNGVEVAREVEVQILHRDDLGEAAARRAALDPEDRAERRLAQAQHGAHADVAQPLGQRHGR